ncbi:sigma 54-interacting transcriptional regulator, partial [candidate division TA06 bacterium]|nr:sigma 54-interacting transcriptional regulator [candidate division TA06 bacterium]
KEMGDLYERKGDYPRALQAYQRALKIHNSQSTLPNPTASLLRKIGTVYQKQSSYDRALTYFRRALKTVEKRDSHAKTGPLSRPSSRDVESEQVEILTEMAWGYRCQGKYREGIICCEKTLEIIGQQIKLKKGMKPKNPMMKQETEKMSKTHYILSVIHWNQGDVEEAIHRCKESLALASTPYRKATALGFLGLLYGQQEAYNQAKGCYEKSLEIQRRIGDLYNQATTQVNLGNLAQGQFDWEEAIRLYEVALSIGERVGDPLKMAKAFLNLGNVYGEKGEWKRGIEFYWKSLKIRQKIGDLSGEARCRNNLGSLLLQMGEFEEGFKELQKSLEIRKKIGDRKGIASSYLYLGEGYKEIQHWKRAMRALEKCRLAFDGSEGGRDERSLSKVYLTEAFVHHEMAGRNKRKGGSGRENRNSIKEKSLEYCQKGLDLAKKTKTLEAEGTGYRILGQILAETENSGRKTKDQSSKSEVYFKKSVKIFRNLRIPFELGRSLLELGKWQKKNADDGRRNIDQRSAVAGSKVHGQKPKLKNLSSIEEAFASIKEAETIFKTLGAKADLERTRSAMDSLTESILSGHWSLNRREKYLDALYLLSDVIQAIQDEEGLLDRVLDLVIKLLKAERGLLLLKNEMSGDLFFAAGREVDQATLEDVTRVSQTITKGVAKTGRPIISGDALIDPRFQSTQSVLLQNIRSLLCVPLISRDEVLGTLYVDSRISENLFSEEDESFLLAIANFIAVTIEKSRVYQALQSENLSLKRSASDGLIHVGFGNLVGESKEMEEVYQLAGQIAQDNCTVLVTGETGTGKSLLARAIHESGKRGRRKFIPIHCGALPEHLLESELFGHKKGSFTDAVEDKPGLFEEANGGTIFLDEIGDAPLTVQIKLLHVLEDESIRRIGETKERKVDVRVICATRRNLEEEIRAMRFREDLYYRLNVFLLHLPPLRDREEDIPLLSQFFLRESSERHHKQILGFKPEVMESLVRYPWPGNVRELMHCIERAVLLTKGSRITLEDIKAEVREVIPEVVPASQIPILNRKDEIEEALRRTKGNITRAAKDL